jgi:type VI secretion system protein ImpA
VRVRIKGLMLDGKWRDVLEQCESVMATPQGRGWLDLQRYVVAACAQLGYDAVGAAVRAELRTLLAAVPRLREMMLMDDTPTANGETQQWLDAERLADDAGTASNGNGASDEADAELGDQTEALATALSEEDATSEHGGLRVGARRRASTQLVPMGADPFALARLELVQGRPNRAIELLLAELSRERSPRGRFVRQTQIAYLMVEAGHYKVALPILERLIAIIDERTLEEWEAGPLVAQPMTLLIRVMDRVEDVESSYARSDLYLRVCRLDPLQALALQPA